MTNERKETIAYSCYKRYQDNFLKRSGVLDVLKQSRRYYKGQQYENTNDGLPKPIINICREYVEKVSAKVVGTPYSVDFISESDDRDLHKLDDFYDYQMGMISDKEFNAEVCKRAFIDGVAVVFTSYDRDTYGGKGIYRGFIKRHIVDFEKVFFENPTLEDYQDQRYIGYAETMTVGACRALIEGSKKRKEEIGKLLIPDTYELIDNANIDEDIDSKTITVITRFFRDEEGEVMFEVCTKYANLYEYPHYLNPKKNEKKLKTIIDDDNKGEDYLNQQSAHYMSYTKAEEQSDKEYSKCLKIFTRYPVSEFRPYPQPNSVLGDSGVGKIIPNQNIINFTLLLQTLIMQSHAMPKYLIKPNALKGQVIDNSPSQIITDYTPYANGNWGITRLNSGDAVNNSLIEFSNNLINITKVTNGFENLTSDNMSGDISGYAYQQYVKQANLTLEIPQKRFWLYIKDNAKTDLNYFRHYVDNAKFYTTMSESEYDMQNSYRNMAMDLQSIGDLPSDGRPLPDIKTVQSRDVTKDDFMKDWEVSIDVQQGILGSEISESQHYNQVFQYVASGNLDPDMIQAFMECDPSFSRKVRSNLVKALEASRNSQVAMLKAQIQQYQSTLQDMATQMKGYAQQINLQQKQVEALKKATVENAELNKQVALDAKANAGMLQSEGEVKSNNAKGIENSSFDGMQDETFIGF